MHTYIYMYVYSYTYTHNLHTPIYIYIYIYTYIYKLQTHRHRVSQDENIARPLQYACAASKLSNIARRFSVLADRGLSMGFAGVFHTVGSRIMGSIRHMAANEGFVISASTIADPAQKWGGKNIFMLRIYYILLRGNTSTLFPPPPPPISYGQFIQKTYRLLNAPLQPISACWRDPARPSLQARPKWYRAVSGGSLGVIPELNSPPPPPPPLLYRSPIQSV
jgi:hypothetical protein